MQDGRCTIELKFRPAIDGDTEQTVVVISGRVESDEISLKCYGSGSEWNISETVPVVSCYLLGL